MPKRVEIGIVTGDKMAKTRRVEVPRLVKHKTYGKYVRRKTVCYVHDENNESAIGDRVEIEESRPLSRMKHWTLVRIVEKNRAAAAVAADAASAKASSEEAPTT